MDFGTDISEAKLPATASATLSDNSTEDISITWDGGAPAYDANTPGTYIFTGTLGASDSFTNTNNLNAIANVIVGQQKEEAPVIQNAVDSVSEAIQGAASGLLNGFWNFIKWIFSGLGSKIPAAGKATSSLLNSADIKSLADGLLKPVINLFK